jgi:superfamily I DNA/RNA helicase
MIILLSPRKFENSIVSSLKTIPVKELKNYSQDPNNEFFGFTTIQAFKGMESNYVVITDIEDLESDIAKSLIYIGMSRAKYSLTILISESARNQYYQILSRKLN